MTGESDPDLYKDRVFRRLNEVADPDDTSIAGAPIEVIRVKPEVLENLQGLFESEPSEETE